VVAVGIASLRPGELAKITGVVAARGELLTAVIGQQRCVGYSAAVETSTRDDGWQRIMTFADCASFHVTDASGTVSVQGTIVIAHHEGVAWESPPANFLARTPDERTDSRRWVVEKLRCREVLLMPGDHVSVLGRATMELDPAARGSYREPPMLPHLRGTESEPVIVANADALEVF
jgi:hypothetical protein